MIKAGDKIVATTGVWLREKFREAGTEFVVAETPKRGAKPIEVDVTTAIAWERAERAKELPKKAAESTK